ncbi:MAG TPA: hypothetical protein DCW88_03570 [Agrobacterium sp.]|uniref:hypothetical protein n=1 Tax=Agrobacterium pusense TaxID=648995 RepID=UPI000E975F5A|nr:hypothetical protein [Agrobacterium sp.]
MTRSVLAAIRASLMPGEADPILDEDQPGATASSPEASPTRADQEEDTMSDPSNTPAGGASQTVAGNSSDDAIKAAGLAGEEKGAKAANDRMAAILGADGIKGDGKRMGAALDLAIGSPGMSADQVTSFVAGNVPASGAANTSVLTDHDRRRAADMPHAQPDKPGPRGDSMRVDIVADMKRRHGVK